MHLKVSRIDRTLALEVSQTTLVRDTFKVELKFVR